MTPAISVENLKVRYRARNGQFLEAVSDLSFTVAPGEVVGFLGPNGAGKSSTLKALMGFVAPEAGRCEIFGLPAGSLDAKTRVGYLPEVAMYYPFLTPLETLRLYGELQGLKGKALREESKTLLELVGLKDAMNKQNRSMSKGMLQRVGIAQSLLGSPDVLILDEVTSGLDPVGRKELRTLLRDRQRQGATLFFSSHELGEVDMLCDRILLIHKGRFVEERQMDGLKEDLRNYLLAYRGDASLLDLTSEWEEVEPGVRKARFHRKEHLIQAIARVQETRGEVLDVVSQEGSLEEYFIEAVAQAA
jgi:ABC-2 type transport system ATP-binding protein